MSINLSAKKHTQIAALALTLAAHFLTAQNASAAVLSENAKRTVKEFQDTDIPFVVMQKHFQFAGGLTKKQTVILMHSKDRLITSVDLPKIEQHGEVSKDEITRTIFTYGIVWAVPNVVKYGLEWVAKEHPVVKIADTIATVGKYGIMASDFFLSQDKDLELPENARLSQVLIAGKHRNRSAADSASKKILRELVKNTRPDKFKDDMVVFTEKKLFTRTIFRINEAGYSLIDSENYFE